MQNGLKIEWSSQSLLRLQEIQTRLEEDFGIKVAQRFSKKIFLLMDRLSVFPEIGSLENSERNIRRFQLIKQISVYYKISNGKIVVINLFDNRQNPDLKKY